MSEIKTNYKLGYKQEDELGNGFIALGAADVTHKFGDYHETNIFQIVMEYQQFRTLLSRDIVELSYGNLSVNPTLSFLLMDGLPFYMVLGKSTDDVDGGVKTHAITAIDGREELPSFVLHYEAEDKAGVSSIYKDFVGCKCAHLRLTAQRFKNIRCDMSFVGLDMITSAKLTTPPAHPGAVMKAFNFGGGTWTWHESSIGSLIGFILDIKTDITRVQVDSDENKYRCKYLNEGDRIITFSITLHLTNSDLIDEIKAQIARSFVVVFQRTDANDKITITLSNCFLLDAPLKHPAPGTENIYIITGIAKTIAVAVRDDITNYEPAQEE